MQHTVEQRADGWFVIMADGQQRLNAYFSNRETAQAVAATLAPATQTERRGARPRPRTSYTQAVAS